MDLYPFVTSNSQDDAYQNFPQNSIFCGTNIIPPWCLPKAAHFPKHQEHGDLSLWKQYSRFSGDSFRDLVKVRLMVTPCAFVCLVFGELYKADFRLSVVLLKNRRNVLVEEVFWKV